MLAAWRAQWLGLRPGFRRTLTVTVLASLAALLPPSWLSFLWPQWGGPVVVVQASSGAHEAQLGPASDQPNAQARSVSDKGRESGPWYLLAGDLPRRDLFSPVLEPVQVPVVKPAVKTVAQVVVAADPPPPLPTPQLQFVGRMATPSGQVLTLVSQHEQILELRPGLQLADGFRVDGIMPDRLRLTHLPTGAQVDYAIPPPADR